jgi:hypothetical protein
MPEDCIYSSDLAYRYFLAEYGGICSHSSPRETVNVGTGEPLSEIIISFALWPLQRFYPRRRKYCPLLLYYRPFRNFV